VAGNSAAVVTARDIPDDGRDQRIAEKRSELETLKRRIEALQDGLRESQGRLRDEDAVLRDVDLRIDTINRRLRELEERKNGVQRELEDLRERRAETDGRLAVEQAILARHLRSAYVSGSQEFLKLLLNQEDPATFSRVLAYYRYLTRDRIDSISRITGYLDELGQLEQGIRQRAGELESLIEQQKQRWSHLDEAYREQKQAIARLHDQIDSDTLELQRLGEDQAALLAVIEKLTLLLDELSAEEREQDIFRDHRGRLSLPVKARIAASFGSRRGVGNLRWQGIVLRAEAGSEVRAIYHGRVVFADWMRGFGLMLIVDHGDGYLSLYGHNESLLAEEGQWIVRDQPIATVGTSGGGSKPGLYFEIRHQGRPQDPLVWCRR